MKTKAKKYKHIFNYENECLRRDAPADGVGDWLDNQAKDIAYRKTGTFWAIDKARLEKQENGGHLYCVTLKPAFS